MSKLEIIADLLETVDTFVANTRRFHPVSMKVQSKVQKIAAYLNQHKICNVVVGVSGGVDSATVFALLVATADSGLLKQPLTIHGVNIVYDMYKQHYDDSYFNTIRNHYQRPDVIWIQRDLSDVEQTLWAGTNTQRRCDVATVRANLSYALRYTAFFSIAQQVGGITFGTTNYDEFGYVGWFGKTSDMVVDVQVIADCHKFQVFDIATALGVPQSIIERRPTGDLITDQTDEAVFGVSYNDLSWYTHMMCTQPHHINPDWKFMFKRVDALHEQNAHKYQGQTFNCVYL